MDGHRQWLNQYHKNAEHEHNFTIMLVSKWIYTVQSTMGTKNWVKVPHCNKDSVGEYVIHGSAIQTTHPTDKSCMRKILWKKFSGLYLEFNALCAPAEHCKSSYNYGIFIHLTCM